ncbi:hypothetical protein [Streptomyces sp. NPDC056160]
MVSTAPVGGGPRTTVTFTGPCDSFPVGMVGVRHRADTASFGDLSLER